jgi:outer membrane protein assembly factor BamB
MAITFMKGEIIMRLFNIVFLGVIFSSLTGLCQADVFPLVEAKPGWQDTLPEMKFGETDWPWWRGPMRDNIVRTTKDAPTQWGETKNLLWRTSIPGAGHSTPIFYKDRIYLTTGEGTASATNLFLIALDKKTGQQVWKVELYSGSWSKPHKDNNYASSTVACDGERLFVTYENGEKLGMLATDLNGKVVWKKWIANYFCAWGISTSPVLYKSALIMAIEGQPGSWMLALNRATGDVIYRRELRKVKQSYGTPMIATIKGKDQILQVGGETTRGYSADTGDLIWECKGPATFCVATPAVNGDMIYATGGYPQREMLAIRADGKGDVTDSHVVWKTDAKVGYVPSPLYSDGVLYAVSDNGLFRAYDALTGKILWDHNFDAPFYSSPLLANGKIYLFDRKGKGHVIPVGREKGTILTSELPAGACATPVVMDGKLFVRTHTDLFCFGTKE